MNSKQLLAVIIIRVTDIRPTGIRDSHGYNTFTQARNLDGISFKKSFVDDLELISWVVAKLIAPQQYIGMGFPRRPAEGL
jgi:hypothetical protein